MLQPDALMFKRLRAPQKIFSFFEKKLLTKIHDRLEFPQIEGTTPKTKTKNQRQKMKINRSTKTEQAAQEILLFLQGNEDITASRQDTIISVSEAGDLLFYNAACGTDDSETVLIDRLESDSMGDGWESATAGDVIDWLETCCD